jgi:transposase
MRVLKIKQHLSKDELKKRMHLQKTVKDFQDYRILYSVPVNEGKSALDIADYPGVSKNRIYKTVEKYNRLGAGRKDTVHHGGRREARCIMSLEKGKQFLRSIEKEALTGERLSINSKGYKVFIYRRNFAPFAQDFAVYVFLILLHMINFASLNMILRNMRY